MFTESKRNTRSLYLQTSCLFVFLVISNCLFSQRINKYFVSNVQDNGILYFIEPEHKWKSTEDNTFEFDITYLSSTDSISLNFSFLSKELEEINNLLFNIEGAEKPISVLCDKIYIDYNKRIWVHRYTSKISHNEFLQLYANNQGPAPKVVVKFKNDECVLFTNERKWRKKSKIINRIFQLTEANK